MKDLIILTKMAAVAVTIMITFFQRGRTWARRHGAQLGENPGPWSGGWGSPWGERGAEQARTSRVCALIQYLGIRGSQISTSNPSYCALIIQINRYITISPLPFQPHSQDRVEFSFPTPSFPLFFPQEVIGFWKPLPICPAHVFSTETTCFLFINNEPYLLLGVCLIASERPILHHPPATLCCSLTLVLKSVLPIRTDPVHSF